jgi:hypothetical protein
VQGDLMVSADPGVADTLMFQKHALTHATIICAFET